MKAGKICVFVVEDHAATARGLKMFLELSGYVTEFATSMQSALSRAEEIQFDVLVCDLNLPDGTGWELLRELRKRRAVRALAFSAFNEPDQIARSKAAGFVEHVVKGTTPESLVAAIARVAKAPEAEKSAVVEVTPESKVQSLAAGKRGRRKAAV
jgi:CheY-like chemotaxis protein